MNKFSTSERLSGLLAFVLSGLFYVTAGMLVVFLSRSTMTDRQPAMGSEAVNLSFSQIELKRAEVPPPKPVPVVPEKADVAFEEIVEEAISEPTPAPVPAQVAQEASAPEAAVKSAEPLAGTVAAVDWRGLAVAKVRAMIEREKYYPTAARNAGYTGWCRVRICLDPDGTIASCEIIERHGHPLLVRGAESTLEKIQGKNVGIKLFDRIEFIQPIEFELQ